MIDGENIASESIIKEALPLLNIAVAEFTANLARMAADPKIAEFVMAAQLGKLNRTEEVQPPKLSRQKTIEVFKKQQELSLEHMRNISETSQNKDMLDIMVEQAKIHDQIFHEHNVDNDTFEESLMYFVLNKDPEIQKNMTEYVEKMQR